MRFIKKSLLTTDPMTNLYNRRYFAEISESIVALDNENFQFTISLGVAQVDIDIRPALKRADDELYQAKNSGRNNVVLMKKVRLKILLIKKI